MLLKLTMEHFLSSSILTLAAILILIGLTMEHFLSSNILISTTILILIGTVRYLLILALGVPLRLNLNASFLRYISPNHKNQT